MIEYTNKIDKLKSNQLDGFYVGWPNPPTLETRLKIMQNSNQVVLAYDNKKLVGFITAITDKTLCAYIPLLEVLPDYQSKGIGSELVKKMLELLKDYYMIDMICDEHLQNYYQKFNMNKSFGMSIRNYDKQLGIK